jgi:hypothetical protein
MIVCLLVFFEGIPIVEVYIGRPFREKRDSV